MIRNCRMLRGSFVNVLIHGIIGGKARSFSEGVFGVSGAAGISMNGGLIAIHDLILLYYYKQTLSIMFVANLEEFLYFC